ncbi:MAG: NADH-quinone oxidoreductase subunit J [Thermoplasmata archaeon]
MVDALQFVFLVISAVEVITAVLVVTAKKLMWAAFWLAISLVTIAGIYLLFQSEFVAIIQILVYAGAVPVIFLFGIMLTRTKAMERVE